MTAIDLFIIYLSCGAPFGVYYFLQNRTSAKLRHLVWIRTLLILFIWMPFAFRLLRRDKNLRRLFRFGSPRLPNVRETNIHSTVKQIEKTLLESDLKISVYEFRETIERYIGLTIAGRAAKTEQTFEAEIEFHKVSQTKDIELAAICLNRRNRKRLLAHQTEARKDFLHLIGQLLESGSDADNLRPLAVELVIDLEDSEAQNKLEKMLASQHSLQTDNRFSVTEAEKDLWKPETHRPSPAQIIPYRLPKMKAAVNLREKD